VFYQDIGNSYIRPVLNKDIGNSYIRPVLNKDIGYSYITLKPSLVM